MFRWKTDEPPQKFMFEVLEAVKTVMIQDDNTEFLDVHKVDIGWLQSLNNFSSMCHTIYL